MAAAKILVENFDLSAAGLAAALEPQVVAFVAGRLRDAAARIRPKVAALVGTAMRADPTAESLAGGRLREELGLGTLAGGPVEGRDAVDGVVGAVQDSIRVEVKGATRGRLGGLYVGAFLTDFSDALSYHWASYTSKGRSGERLVEWLKWLLFRGDALIITTHTLVRWRPTAASRTGRPFMLKRRPDSPSSLPIGWGIPSDFAGTANANWLTRSADRARGDVEAVLVQEVGAALRA